MGYPKTLVTFKQWLKPGKKLVYKGKKHSITSVRSQSFDIKDSQGNILRIPTVMGNNIFKGKSICLNGTELVFIN